MAAKTPAKKTVAKDKAEEAPNLPAVISDDEFTAALRESGFLPASAGGAEFNRLTVKNGNTVVDSNGDIIAVYDPRKKEPALIVQLKSSPKEYQALWFSKPGDTDPQSNSGLAEVIGHPEKSGRFCKSHFDDPNENRDYSIFGDSCHECPVHPFVPKEQLPPEAKGKRCAWKADIEFVILEQKEDGTLGLTEAFGGTVWTMTLSTTGIIEFKGSSSKKNDGLAGSVSPENTNVRIAKLGMQKWGKEGILKAKTYLELGGVICGLHLLSTSNEDRSRTWTVPSFDPLDILEIEEQPALETSETNNNGDVSTDDIPF